ncbi:transcriptional regulator [Vibrio sp. BS-M-Sm-2]|uniref:winged helix-turn-helix domain-containing protein n=1 Tax=Vibrio sp. BS-M-Sm-2 TaxID=3241167 RepID=UPI00390CBD9C
MSLIYLIADCIAFDPHGKCIYRYDSFNRKQTIKYDIGDNSSDILMELIVSGTYLSVEQLLEEVWRKQRQVEVDVTSVRQAVSKLRRSLKIVAPQVDVIKTIPKKGYLFDANVELISKGGNRKERAPVVVLVLLSIVMLVFLINFFSYYIKSPEDSPFSKVVGIDLVDSSLNVVQSKHHPVDKKLLPIFSKCISELNLFDADTVAIYSTTEDFLSLTAFYEEPNKRQITFRLILSKVFNKEHYKCGLL